MPTKSTKKEETEAMSFEKALERLSAIADILENETPSLEGALDLYEEGAALLKSCSEALNKAEAKITLLTKEE